MSSQTLTMINGYSKPCGENLLPVLETFLLTNIRRHCKKNNTAGGGGDIVTFAMDSMYSFFNHSCEFPPMIRGTEDGSSRQVWYSSRDIKKGDEVCTTYVMGLAPKAVRQQQLEPWLAGPCACKRCLSER